MKARMRFIGGDSSLLNENRIVSNNQSMCKYIFIIHYRKSIRIYVFIGGIIPMVIKYRSLIELEGNESSKRTRIAHLSRSEVNVPDW